MMRTFLFLLSSTLLGFCFSARASYIASPLQNVIDNSTTNLSNSSTKLLAAINGTQNLIDNTTTNLSNSSTKLLASINGTQNLIDNTTTNLSNSNIQQLTTTNGTAIDSILRNSTNLRNISGVVSSNSTLGVAGGGGPLENNTQPQLPQLNTPLAGGGILNSGPGDKSTVKYESKLLQNIVGNYTPGMRPVQSSKMPAKIGFEMKLNKLVDLNTKEQVLTVDAFVIMRWIDPQLKWDADDYNGTDIVNIPSAKVWTPDIVLYNNAENIGKAHSDIYTAPVVVNQNGSISWINAVTLKASCSIDIKLFPFDNQNCSLSFGSWSYGAYRLKIEFVPAKSKGQMTDSLYVSNGIWDFIEVNSGSDEKKFSCCEEPFSHVVYNFTLKRRPTFFLLYLILPCVAIASLSLVSYIIPTEAGERIGFGVTVMLSFSVYLIVIADKLPEKSDAPPLLGILYVVTFYMLVSSFLVSSYNVRLYFNKHRPPQWLVKLAQRPKKPWRVPFRKKSKIGDAAKTTVVCPFEESDHEIGAKRVDNADLECHEDGTNSRMEEESVKERYQSQWREISAYLDNIAFRAFASFIVICPIIVYQKM